MSFTSVKRHLLSTMIVVATLNTPSQRVALAQIPEAPGDIESPQGEVEVPGGLFQDPSEGSRPRRERAKPKKAKPTPDAALETIDEMQRARERAMGTPEPEPPPNWK